MSKNPSKKLKIAQILVLIGFLSIAADYLEIGNLTGVLILFPILFSVALILSIVSFALGWKKPSFFVSILLILTGLIGIVLFIPSIIGMLIWIVVLVLGIVKTLITTSRRDALAKKGLAKKVGENNN